MNILDMFPIKQVSGEVGIEIEMEGVGLINGGATKNWKTVADASLRGHSAEYVLKAPVLREKALAVLEELNDAFRRHECALDPSDRCGVHIHLNVQKETFNSTLTIIGLYLALEELMVKYCGTSREGNLFCLRASDAEALTIELQRCVRRQDFFPVQNDHFRYASLNCSSLSKYGSLEFRALQTPPDILDIHTWISLLLKIKDAAKQFSSVAAVVEGMSVSGAKRFIDDVFGELAVKLYTPDMDKMLIEGVRRVQDLAYIQPEPEANKPIHKKEHLMMGDVHVEAPNEQDFNAFFDEQLRLAEIQKRAIRAGGVPGNKNRRVVPDMPPLEWRPLPGAKAPKKPIKKRAKRPIPPPVER